jgi:hypothetical protein
MGVMKIKLSKIEARLQALIEGSAARLFPSRRQQTDLASSLINAMWKDTHPGAEGRPLAPNLFMITVHPVQAQVLRENEIILDGLTQTLREAGTEAGLVFASPPVIRIEESPELVPGEFQVRTLNSRRNLTQTSDLVVENWTESENVPPNAFLIVDGVRIYPIERAVTNIGRREDNQLIIEDGRVSRVHAQLRVIKGRFVIFDLDSSGGTFVNGERISQASLYPGDVISIAGVPVVFGQDSTGIGETQDLDLAVD